MLDGGGGGGGGVLCICACMNVHTHVSASNNELQEIGPAHLTLQQMYRSERRD